MVVWYPFRRLNRALPLSFNFFLFEAMGDLACCLKREKRALLISRLSVLFPHMTCSERMRQVRSCFRNYFVDRLLINLIPHLNHENVHNIAKVQGEEHLNHALAQGRGVLLLHPHFGPSQLPLIYLGHTGYRLAQVGFREMGTRVIGRATDRLRLQLEALMPVTHFYADNYIRPIVRWIEGGGILMTAGDGTGGGRHIGRFNKVSLLERCFEMPVGPYRIAAIHNSPILPIIAVRQRSGFYNIIIHPPLDQSHNAEHTQRQFAKWLEYYLKLAPGQWHFWDEWSLK